MPATRLGQVTRIAAVKKSHKLLIQWQLPPTAKDYKNKQYEYIGHLLGDQYFIHTFIHTGACMFLSQLMAPGHEGSGSLLSNLKRLQLATNLSAGVDSSCNFDRFVCMYVCVYLYVTIWSYQMHTIHTYIHTYRIYSIYRTINREAINYFFY